VRPALILLLLLPLLAWGNPVSTEQVTARLVAERAAAAPGDTAELLLVLDIRPGWHTYWRNPGDSGEAPRIDWTLPAGVEAGPLRFPTPELIRVGPLANFGYLGRALHPVSLRVPAGWPVGEPIRARAEAHWLVCEEHCIPESAVLELSLPVAERPGATDPAVAGLFAEAREGLPQGSIPDALLRVTAEGARLEVPLDDAIPPPVAVRYFPSSWGLIEHAAEQPWRLVSGEGGDRIQVDLTPDAGLASIDPGGLLSLRGPDGVTRSYELAPGRVAERASGREGASSLGLPLALGFAFLGGLILNLMPCVFPVLAIKAMGLAGQGALASRDRAFHGLSYTVGVLVFFGLLGGLLLALRAGGAALGWGFQLQYPPFVAAMAYLFLVLGLALSGALTLGARLMGLAAGPQRPGQGVAAAFATGALAALVAAPCTAPFMGAALGYAVTLSWPLALAILLTLGLGLAAPYLLLSLWPALAARLPRPGPWMDVLKQLLSFPLFATAAWLLWVLSVQSGPTGVALVLSGMLLLAFGLWVRERTLLAPAPWPWLGSAASILGLSVALWLALLAEGTGIEGPPDTPAIETAEGARPQPAQAPYSAERLAAARAEGRPVLVNMTAAWCITCLVNERVALSTRRVVEQLAAKDVLYLKGDWTNRDPAITDYLAGFGRTGVPIYVLYPRVGEPRVLPQILTPAIVESAIASLGDSAPSQPKGESP
jgi:thiol:disulfide interchange protein DsbD